MALVGIAGHPWIDLTPFVDEGAVHALHEEICLGLLRVERRYTGGSHRSLGIVPEESPDPPLPDYGEVIAGLSDAQLAIFAGLGEGLHGPDRSLRYGEEGDVPLTMDQLRWLRYRHGVYFPWKTYVELVPSSDWADKSNARGKRFTREAQLYFPHTVRLVRTLPFRAIGSVKILGLDGGDHGTIHRDGDPADQSSPDTFVTLCPGRDKRLFLWDEATGARTTIEATAYWFNDHDWHGVHADPRFRYSIRIDGTFEPDFLQRLGVQ